MKFAVRIIKNTFYPVIYEPVLEKWIEHGKMGLVITEKGEEVHKIFVSDVDGLIVGSPVNLMGVPVGHVTKLKFVRDDEIYIRFIIKQIYLNVKEFKRYEKIKTWSCRMWKNDGR